MPAAPKPDLPAQLAEAFAWWRDAGVDCDFLDEPVAWLAQAPAPEPSQVREGRDQGPTKRNFSAKPPSSQRDRGSVGDTLGYPAIDPKTLPGSLEEFPGWWLAEPALDGGRTSGRVPPRGCAGAALMVLVPEPEAEDRERLLSGAQGRLLDAMLGAMGLGFDEVYLASVLPRHMPMPDWSALRAQGMGKVLAHHVRLVAPRRLVAFGTGILPLMGNDPPNRPAALRQFNHEDISLPLLAARDLATLLDRPRWKADVWRAWLEWTAEAPQGRGTLGDHG